MVISCSRARIENVPQFTATTRNFHLFDLAAQTDLPGAECGTVILSDDLRPMHQEGNELKACSLRKPCIRYIGASLKLIDHRRAIEAAAFQLNRDHPAPCSLLPEKQVIAALSSRRDAQGFAVEIDNDSPARFRADGDRTSILVASMDPAGAGNRVRDGFDDPTHFCLLSWIRL